MCRLMWSEKTMTDPVHTRITIVYLIAAKLQLPTVTNPMPVYMA